jgi:twitching motility protein PilI
MSTKDASSQLQTSLTDRSQGQQVNETAASWLGVEVESSGFLFPLDQAGEIFPWVDLHPIPYAKPWFLGVANLRGMLCGVAHLGAYLNVKHSTDETAEPVRHISTDRRLIGFHPALEMNTVLMVDKLAGLKNARQLTLTQVHGQLLDGNGKMWQEVDLLALSKDPQFLQISAY